MYSKHGENYFIVDAHVALWDARESNLKNVHGKQFIDCFYDYHKNLSPEEVVWDYDTYTYYGGDRLMKDLFEDGYVDHAIFQPAALGDFYNNGFGQTEEAWALTRANPGKLTYNHNFDPRNEQAGLDQLKRDAERFGLKGVKLYTAEWHGGSRGYKLTDPRTYKYLEACEELGITNIHVHKGPTIIPLDRDAFDVADVDSVATDFQGSQLRRRALRPAAPGGLLLDRHPGDQRPRRPRGGDAVHPHAASVLRPDHRRAPLLGRRGQDPVLERLRDLDAEVAHRGVRRLPDPRRHDRVPRAHGDRQEEDPWPQRGQDVWPQRARRSPTCGRR
ncbi:amidohydrolase [Nocardioides sp. B-3]|nr:amidohydrolase [Nocardioides sp. B-3]UUZ58454.1 amidohydrolase [Nocardioides sp. B-3]